MAENSQAVIPDNLILVDGEIGGLPSSSPSDAGKVLTVDSEGSPEWVTPSGGTQYAEGNGIDISEENVISIDTTVVATQNDLSSKQDTLTAGTNISISDNTISATDTTYTAGTGLSLTGTEFSVDTTVVATQTDLGNVRQVPSSTSADENKVLTVNSSGNAEWANAPTELPTASSADNGKVLGVTDTSGTLSWVAQTPAQVNADWNAVSGAAEILNKPTIPAAQVNSDWNAASGVAQILNKPSLATVATTGAYSDLSGTPTIPTVDQTYNAASTNAQSGTAVAGAISTVNQVPSSTSSDENKVLTVNAQGTPAWANTQLPDEKSLASTNNTISITEGANTVSIDVANPLPSTLGTAGQILAVNSGATGVEWANAPSGDAVMITLNAAPSTSSEKQALFEQVTSAVYAGKEVFLRLNKNSGFGGSYTLQLACVRGPVDSTSSCECHFSGVDDGYFTSPSSQYTVYQNVVVIMFDGNDYYDFVSYQIPLATANANSFDPFSA